MERTYITLMDEIFKRDRWSCKRCGDKFGKLFAWQFCSGEYITVCESCRDWALKNAEESKKIFTDAIRVNKIVFVGDCHGNFTKLDSVLTEEDPTMFISVGDVGTLKDVTSSDLDIIDKWKDKGFAIRGNHDNVDFFNRIGLVQEINGLQVVGLNGMFKTRNFINETKGNISFREVFYLAHLRNIDIFVTHQPPTGLYENAGEVVFEELLRYLNAKIAVSGHLHTYKLNFYLQTFVISLPMIDKGYAVATFQGRELRNMEIVLKKGKKVIRV